MLNMNPYFSSLHYSRSFSGAAIVKIKIDKNPEEYGCIYRKDGKNDEFLQNSEQLRDWVAYVKAHPDSQRAKLLTYDPNTPSSYGNQIPDFLIYCKKAEGRHKDIKSPIPKEDWALYKFAFDPRGLISSLEPVFSQKNKPMALDSNTTFTYRQQS